MSEQTDQQTEQYAIGDLLGKGAFGSVFRGLNLETGEVVAIKQIKLIGCPKAQLNSMMMEIDLLKKLNHKHIVRYIGFFKTKENLNILIEFCESGSLLHVMKKFGNFSDKLVGMYTAQVLEGLKYLHEQGVIHRDIKAANLLTDKSGVVKLADFGIASTTNGSQDVAGSPYWMAPEIVELNGATTASDVWSLGATVIELCTGNPPYIELPAMAALFRIVQEDCPPLPPQCSEIVKDFLQQCFQKDPNLRVTAQKLMKHPWMIQSRRKDMVEQPVVDVPSSMKTIPPISKHSAKMGNISQIKPDSRLAKYSENNEENWAENIDIEDKKSKLAQNVPKIKIAKEGGDDFDDFFTEDNEPASRPLAKLKLPNLPVASTAEPKSVSKKKEMQKFIDNEVDDFFEPESPVNENLVVQSPEFQETNWEDEDDSKSTGLEITKSIRKPTGSKSKKPHVNSLFRNSNSSFASDDKPPSTLGSFQEDEHDDFSDIVSSKISGTASLRLKQAISFDDEEEDDPFLVSENEDDQDFSDYDLKDFKAKRLSDLMKHLDILLPGKLESEILEAGNKVLNLIAEDSELKKTVVGYHGMIPIIELLGITKDLRVIEVLLKLVNSIALESPDILENICLVGAIPIVLRYSDKPYPKNLIKEVAKFISLLNLTKATLQMFIISNGFSVLISMLEEKVDHEIIWIAVDAIRSIFDLPMKSIKNDLCRLLIKCKILNLLIDALQFSIKFRGSESTEYCQKILNIFLLFSQSDTTVKRNFADPPIIHGIFKINVELLKMMDYIPSHLQVIVLKVIKNLSMDSSNLDNLEKAGCVEKLCRLLGNDSGPYVNDIKNQSLNALFYLCRINKQRQEFACQYSLKSLLDAANTSSTLKQFALPILSEFPTNKYCKKYINNESTMKQYMLFLEDSNWVVNILEAIVSWCQDDLILLESHIIDSIGRIVNALNNTRGQYFVGLLDSILKLCQISENISNAISKNNDMIKSLLDKVMTQKKPIARVKILKIVAELLQHSAKLNGKQNEKLEQLYRNDSAVLVKELCHQILQK